MHKLIIDHKSIESGITNSFQVKASHDLGSDVQSTLERFTVNEAQGVLRRCLSVIRASGRLVTQRLPIDVNVKIGKMYHSLNDLGSLLMRRRKLLYTSGRLISCRQPFPQPKRRLVKQTFNLIVALNFLLAGFTSCDKLVDVPPPQDAISNSEMFGTDFSATSAVTGLYSKMNVVSIQFANGAITAYTGLAGDELMSTAATSGSAKEFESNAITPTNNVINNNFWAKAYEYIYQANLCIEGLNRSSTISAPVKSQLLGESKLIRAHLYFSLINLFGDVPLVLGTNYELNATLKRESVVVIKEQILQDILDAESLLTTTYPSTGSVRANKFAATSLLARFYLYDGQWNPAELAASRVINSGMYKLETDLNKVFLVGNKECILQLASSITGYNTAEGATFIPGSGASALPSYALSDSLMKSFESLDKRKSSWTSSKTVSSKVYYYPYKYKAPRNTAAPSITEHYALYRLSELYLIRAEAKAQQGKLSGDESAVSDINVIRKRAGLLETNVTGKEEVMAAIERERRVELFCEGGHRWFDMKRLKRANEVFGKIKMDWQPSDTLFPIPEAELLLNRNLKQNDGY